MAARIAAPDAIRSASSATLKPSREELSERRQHEQRQRAGWVLEREVAIRHGSSRNRLAVAPEERHVREADVDLEQDSRREPGGDEEPHRREQAPAFRRHRR